jgi:hypothetical protein
VSVFLSCLVGVVHIAGLASKMITHSASRLLYCIDVILVGLQTASYSVREMPDGFSKNSVRSVSDSVSYWNIVGINVFKEASLEGQMMCLSDYEVLASNVKEQV